MRWSCFLPAGVEKRSRLIDSHDHSSTFHDHMGCIYRTFVPVIRVGIANW